MNNSQQFIEAEPCNLRFLGLQPYDTIWQQMLEFTLNRGPTVKDELWIVQHEPVFTLGQAGKTEHILDAHNIPVLKTDRGGQVTYHGPGQLVIYLLIDVRRAKLGVRQLVDLIENSIKQVLADYGVTAETRPRAPGVYVDGMKIAALGLRIKGGCSYHGLSFNIDMDLEPFTYINPCGYAGLHVTQLIDQLDQPVAGIFQHAQDKLLNAIQQNLLQSAPVFAV